MYIKPLDITLQSHPAFLNSSCSVSLSIFPPIHCLTSTSFVNKYFHFMPSATEFAISAAFSTPWKCSSGVRVFVPCHVAARHGTARDVSALHLIRYEGTFTQTARAYICKDHNSGFKVLSHILYRLLLHNAGFLGMVHWMFSA